MRSKWARSVLSVWLAGLLLAPPSYALRASEGKPSTAGIVIPDTGLSEEQKIVHLRNRIGYGPRPGDVERVKRIGIAAYIEQQLDPESIVDEGVEQRLAGFETLKMKPQQLLAAYPPPQLLRQIDRRIGARQGMDPEAMEQAFPELQRMRERQQRQQQDGSNTAAQRKQGNTQAADPSTSSGRGSQGEPRQRMQEAMNGPQRIVIELSQAKILRAAYSERQLQEVMTDFWFNHFNVFIGKGADRWLTTSYEQEAIRPNALGKFRDLLGATARHPAMLFYLDNWLSSDPKADFDERDLRRRYLGAMQQQGIQPGGMLRDLYARRGLNPEQIDRYFERQRLAMNDDDPFNARGMARRGPQANARRPPQQQQQGRRGLNENYARELMELHTLGVDGGYTQQDIIEVARCFTGWTLTPLPMGQQFIYVDELHDKGAKTVLGQTIKNSGQRDAERVLDIVARHPSTARFVSTKLARRFVSDNPPASLVDKMARTFTETDGDIRAVLRTMFSSEEFWAPEAVNAKVKTPFEFVVGAVRATDAEVADLPPGLVVAMRELGQPLYGAQPPTGYKDTADAWVSTGALLNRMKVAMGLASNRLPGVQVELPRTAGEISSEQLVAQLGQQLLSRPLPEATCKAIEAELAKASGETQAAGAEGRTRLAMGWLLASPDFQRR